MDKKTVSIKMGLPHFIFGTLTAIIGYSKHSSIFWSIIDYLFFPLVWIKWLVLQQINLTIIREAFDFFLK